MEATTKKTSASRKNSLDFIRLMLAGLVIVAHSPELIDGNQSREIIHRIFGNGTFGSIAVDGFFVLSGYLIAQSWLRRPDLRDFFVKRILRIYPGFIVASLVCLLIVGPIGNGSLDYITRDGIQRFIKGVLILQPGFAPSFPGSNYPVSNGALWTIPYEFLCYIGVALLGVVGLLKTKRPILFPLAALILISVHLFPHAYGPIPKFEAFLERHHLFQGFYRLIAFYLMGIGFYYYQERLLKLQKWAPICGTVLLVCMFNEIAQNYALLTLGTFLLFVYGLRNYSWLERLNYKEDFSYGFYLYGWPIQKLIVMKFPNISPLGLDAFAIPLSLLAGFVSWRLVEKPFLKLKSKRREASAPIEISEPMPVRT